MTFALLIPARSLFERLFEAFLLIFGSSVGRPITE